ncbi:MAG: adenylyl-sulfate kinase [Bacteroidetes bacterium]|nr:adenylyl-sulfate kinase [Bacteroidota bacterium]
MNTSGIHPVFNRIMNRADKEKLLRQKAKVIWITGLSGAGKTTLASGIEQELNIRGHLTQVLDGDNIRMGISNDLGFSENDRYENIRRIAEVSKLFLNCGIITINCFISPTREIREMAGSIIGREDFIEVYLSASLEVCEQRDTKGLYTKARRGEIKNFTGIDSPFEPPVNPAITIDSGILTIEETRQRLLELVLPLVKDVCTI